VSLRQDRLRLRRVFGTLLLVAAPVTVAEACTSGATSGSGAGVDAAGGPDAVDEAEGDALGDVLSPPDASCSNVQGGPRDADPDADADADPGCYYILPCGVTGSGVEIVGCTVYQADPASEPLDARALGCWVVEGQGCMQDVYAPPPSGMVRIDCYDCLGGGGRRPRGLRPTRAARPSTELGAYFARMAFEEAASIHAFSRLGRELTRFGAPEALVQAAQRSMRDEKRHARLMAGCARACGARSPAARVRRDRPRTLEAMALENAVEGCVHETFGALLVAWQAEHAATPTLRRTFARIAADEARHAALAWSVARWAEGRVDRRARVRISAGRARAVRALRRRIREGAPSVVERLVGHPPREHAAVLLDRLAAALALD
jgi:hypothetical protein